MDKLQQENDEGLQDYSVYETFDFSEYPDEMNSKDRLVYLVVLSNHP